MRDPEIIDNVLTPIHFEAIKNIIGGEHFEWFWNPRLNTYQQTDDNLNHCFLNHIFNIYNNSVSAPYAQIFIPLFKVLKVQVLVRMHANMYMRTEKIEEHADHKDQLFPCKAAILYLNTCDGSTVINKKHRVKSVANRIVKFRGDCLHHSTSCTNDKRRLVLNINYI